MSLFPCYYINQPGYRVFAIVSNSDVSFTYSSKFIYFARDLVMLEFSHVVRRPNLCEFATHIIITYSNAY